MTNDQFEKAQRLREQIRYLGEATNDSTRDIYPSYPNQLDIELRDRFLKVFQEQKDQMLSALQNIKGDLMEEFKNL